MSMYRPHWIPETQHWSSPAASSTAAPVSSSRLQNLSPPLVGQQQPPSPPKEAGGHNNHQQHELPPSSSSSSESTKNDFEILEAAASNSEVKDVKPHADDLKNYQTPTHAYYQQHYGVHNDLSSSNSTAFSTFNPATTASTVRSNPRPASSSAGGPKSNKNRPSNGKWTRQSEME